MKLPLHPEFLTHSKGDTFLLAISGGRDSVALLHSLLEHGYDKLVLCHVNHRLRAADSEQDAAWVEDLAKRFDLPCELTSVDVASVAESRQQSIELAARNTRHQFFSRCAVQHHCHCVLLAHHADDQAETILFNLLRGSGGLKGMDHASQHEIDGVSLQFLRPLLQTTRSDIDAYIQQQHISYREDHSNAQAVATRNRLRNEALPLLEDIMGRNVKPALVRAAAIAQSTQQSLQEVLQGYELEDPQGRLYLPTLASLSPALRQMAVHDYLQKHQVAEISSDLITRCLSLIEDSSIAKVNLPQDRYFRRKEKRLFIDSSPSHPSCE
ncbi:tRNA lysidine(34) synthetase TilS [Verrucomicrobiaceae bacterium 5K15]|uniref:tRNA(Ile)-lysidine synthase n=1 Tax=Oceaniferula flava TaxID=2800421 RepID=A0AAE2S9Y3_9BACT|nr:tRNA lysidine(34) synthetase TilS [Oceaniferula flavus]MBK1854478.1 tRNA lysidine(34) synthetase TilS [Oceaniferula flavus]MBM1135784.1 tRNA lysidine(34) synthetase TilS [Oceaniferula flavus]